MSAEATAPLGRIGRLDRVDAALGGALVVGVILTLAVVAVPDFHGHVIAPAVDLTFDTIALVVTAAVAALSWIRYRQNHQPMAHAQAAAFLALVVADVVAIAVALNGDLGSVPLPSTASQDALFVWTAARLLAAGILVVGGLETLRGGRPRFPLLYLLGSAAFMVIVTAAVVAFGDSLTSLLSTPMPDSWVFASGDIALTPLGSLVHLVSAALFLGAAVVARQLWRRDGAVGHAWLAFGLVVAAFAQVHGMLFTTRHPDQMGTSDALWLGFAVVLFFGIQAEAKANMAALRAANESLARLRVAEVERAALEERARLSRELHDGLAQDLWLAQLKIGRLAASTALTPEDRTLAEEATKAVEMGLTEARQGVMALRASADESQSFSALLERCVDDMIDRFGLHVEYECTGRLPELSPLVKANLLRIVQEALSNATRHADAKTIRLRVAGDDGRISLVVEDDGRGFAPEDVAAGHVGLVVMRERAASIGVQVTVESRRRGGTRVVITVPAQAGLAVGGVVPR